MQTSTHSLSIGTHGVPWTQKEKDLWLAQQTNKRLYAEDVLAKLDSLKDSWELIQYGSLEYERSYPLFAIRTRKPAPQKPNILITGGVHGYETSGVQGALKFMAENAMDYEQEFNFIVLPCISPWGYETINRWNPKAIDPNRSFKVGGLAQEAIKAMDYIRRLGIEILAHLDLHETTDTDNTEFRPALFARDGITEGRLDEIPDGFYLVGDSLNPVNEFQTAIIQSVKKVTHIAPADQQGKILGIRVSQDGVIHFDVASQGLCGGFSKAPFTTTTEVYPDSPKVTADNCNDAQVAAITGALDYLLARG